MNSSQPSRGTIPSSAAKAIGTPHANAMPSTNCGAEKNRFVNGYSTVTAAPTIASNTVSLFSVSTRPSAISISAANRSSASIGATSPVASGRSAVRSTWPSIRRSAKSLITQPAERATIVPSTRIRNTCCCGLPAAAIQSAHNVGNSSSQMPIGRCSRMSRP